MGRIEDVLNKEFRPRVEMYVGYPDFLPLSIWIEGVDFANERAFPEELSDLCGFKEWLLLKLGGSAAQRWPSIIHDNFGNSESTVEKFFELFDKFRVDVENQSLEKIFEHFREWEQKRYRPDPD